MSHTDSLVTAPLSSAEQIMRKIADLQEAMQKQLPEYESILHTIHRNLAQDESTVHLLTEEQVGIIVAALSKRTGVAITEERMEKAGKRAKKSGGLSLEDL